MNSLLFGLSIVVFFIFDLILRVFIFFKSFRWVNPKSKIPTKKLLIISLLILVAPNVVAIVGFLFLNSGLGRLMVIVLGLVVFVTGFAFLAKFADISVGRFFGTFFLYLVLFLPFYEITRFCIRPYTNPAGSMEDTLCVGDYVLSNNIIYGHSFFHRTQRYFQSRTPQRGDLVVFLFPQDLSKNFVKRCVGVPGDIVRLSGAELYVNGVKQAEPYVKHTATPDEIKAEEGPNSVKLNFGPVTVEAGHYFMLGDNRDNSYDSRYWGTLDEKLILGKIMGIYWRGKDHMPLLQTFP